ncbi:MAG TPA: AbrB/MazE/SpoVT family DNA-binding domain-containing protein [Candidatus Magasanikbacteria bacterium]|nr:AbrB/MazE/SpoVT family DNA-binding domain-containing protein [Candidatus Magasanikbacteria bacterium]
MKKIKKQFNHFCGECYGTTTVGERGQIVIPKKLREKLEIKNSDRFLVMERGGVIVLLPADMVETFVAGIVDNLKNK